LSQGSPRTITVGTNPNNDCPRLYVQSRRAGSTDYNRRYPWTRIIYEGRYTSSSNGEVVTKRASVSVYMGTRSEGMTDPVAFINAGRAGLQCGRDEWYVNIIQWTDTAQMIE
jgi:hypothetical protein